MLRLSLAVVPVSLLCLVGCGSPGELGEGFPAPEQTGYAGTGTSAAGAPPAMNPMSLGGTGGMGMGMAGSGAMPTAGTGGLPAPSAGDFGPVIPGCDIPGILNRSSSEGGCAGGFCHGPNGTPPDLISEGVVGRLLGASASGGDCAGSPLVGDGGTDSYLLTKIVGNGEPIECGVSMPYNEPITVIADDERQCLVDWINAIAGGAE